MSGEITQLLTQVASDLQERNRSSSVQPNQTKTTASNGTDNSQDISEISGEDRMGKEEFLELLVTQLKNQDPLSPMENKEFIAQMAQFSSLEQMQNMNKNMESFIRAETLNQGAALVGKTVETINPDTGETLEGKVERVSFEDDEVYASLDNGSVLNINDITAIH